MRDWWTTQLDYVFLVYGLAFILLAVTCYGISARGDRRLAWHCLALFGLLHGLNEWLDMLAIGLNDSPAFKWVRLILLAASFVPLFEFGRRSLQSQGWRMPGAWMIVPLLMLAGLGGLAGVNGLNASCRYSLGLPGALLGGWVLLRAARRAEIGPRWPLQLAGIALLLYAPAAGLIVPKAGFFPAHVLNHEAFLATAGLPIQIIRCLCAGGCAFGLFMACCRVNTRNEESRKLTPWVIPIALSVLLSGGWFATNWRTKAKDGEMRDELLRQATSIAHTIIPEQVKTLSFTDADKANPVFLRLREQMAVYRPVVRCRGIYTMARRNGQLVFGPESYPENDPQASTPGTVYEQPTEDIRQFFRVGRAFVEGPFADEYGTFVSAFAPVFDPRSGEVLLAVGLDIEAANWQAALARERLITNSYALVLSAILLAGVLVLRSRKQLPVDRQGRLRYAEAFLMAAFGLGLTFIATLFLHDSETSARRTLFTQLAEIQAERIAEQLHDMKENQLGSVARFYEGSQEVNRDEFRIFTDPIIKQGGIQAMKWIPAISAAEKEPLETQVRALGLGDFTIWQKGPEGQREPASGRESYYPVKYVEPLAGNEAALGYDLGSEPVRRAALKKAFETGLPTVTDPITLVQAQGNQTSEIMFHPIFSRQKGDRSLRGFALAVLQLESLLLKTFDPKQSGGDAPVILNMFQLQSGQTPHFLASSSPRNAEQHATGNATQTAVHVEHGKLSSVYPVAVCDKSYVVVVQPGPAFLENHPQRSGWISTLVGLLLTAVLTMFTVQVTRRRADLETQVRARTAALRESQQSMEEQRHLLANVIEGTNVGTWRWNVQTGETEFNERWAEIVGYTLEELAPVTVQTWLDLAHADDLKECETLIQEHLTGCLDHYDCECRMRHKDGFWVWVHDRGKVVEWTADGRPLVMAGTHSDITDRKQAEEVLATRKAELDLALKSAQMGAWHWDIAENKRVFDDQVCRLLGIAPGTFTGTAKEFLDTIHPDDRKPINTALSRTLKEGVPYELEYRTVWPDGSIHYLVAKGAVTYDKDGRPARLNGIVLDTTERKQAEEKLRLFMSIIESSRNAVAITDLDGRFVYINPSHEKLFGRTLEEARATNYRDCYPPESIEILNQEVVPALAQGKAWEGELDAVDAQGRRFPLWESAESLRDEDGKMRYAFGIMSDITERKRAEEVLLESEATQRQLIASLTFGVVIIDPQTRTIENVNETAAIMFGAPEEDIIGRRCHAFLCPACEGACPACDLDMEVDNAEKEMLLADGSLRSILKSVKRIQMHGQEKLLECFIDITDRKQAEESLVSHARQQVEVAQFGQFALAGNSLDDLFDRAVSTVSQILGTKYAKVLEHRPEEGVLFLRAGVGWKEGWVGRKSVPDGPGSQGGYTLLQQGPVIAEDIHNEARFSPPALLTEHDAVGGMTVAIPGADRPFGVLGVHTDQMQRFSENDAHFLESIANILAGAIRQSQAEEEMRTTNERLEDQTALASSMAVRAEMANAAKSEFLANMSHEIRTPMTAILGFSEAIKDGCPAKCGFGESEHRQHVETIIRNGEYLLQLINDILDLSKIEAGKLAVEKITCCPRQIVAEVESLVLTRSRAKGIELRIEFEGGIPETIQSDSTRLRQILINLAGNAIKFTEVGHVTLLTRLAGHSSTEPMLEFDVVDTGIGMTDEQAERLFQPFSQADASTTRKFGGTGLGLTISKRLAEALGGDVRIVKTHPGEGSCFRVTIATGPLAGVRMLEHTAAAAHVQSKPQRKTGKDSIPLDCGILLAEDGPDNQRLITHILRKAGAEVTVVENGQFAVEKALTTSNPKGKDNPQHPFDIILMDMQMPVMDGYEATGQLRQQGYTGPIIALTAHAMASDRQKCIDAGCDDYASKPVDRQKLIETIRRHVEKARKSKGKPTKKTDALVS